MRMSVDEIPHSFLDGYAPLLQHLHIEALCKDMLWTSPLLTDRITSLKLPHVDEINPSMDKVLDGLERMCALEHLKMYPFFLNDPEVLAWESAASGQRRLISLANLIDLDMQTVPRDLKILLSHLSLPPHVVVSLQLLDVPDDPASFFQFTLASVNSHADSTLDSVNAVTSLHVSPSRRGTTIIARKDDDRPSKPTLSIRFTLDRVTLPALTAFFSSHLKVLNVLHHDEVPWRDVLGHAPRLQCLTVGGNTAISLCAALCPTDAEPILLLPALYILTLACLRLDMPHEPRAATEASTRLADALPLCLAARAAAGCQLEELDVVECDVDEAWMANVRGALPGTRVKWDEGTRGRARAEGATTATR
ncbi:hypothetical protein FA95DRAFT_903096 [Auriscalpium vulgare]|uniref:Uncharacterized protein n=1 Tax=Auriscalpium vulgare TaxID=40419 RepID=A0ACB8R8L8_9AGAM|nr:hypothetical protein FA95DRAFT_903096 [Auriscalpium vulgare]